MKVHLLKKHMRIGLFIFLCFVANTAFYQALAQDCQIEKRATLPIAFDHGLPVVAVMMDGHSISLGVDTGAETTFITPEAAAFMHLPQDRHHSTNSIGVAGSKIAPNVIVDDMRFGLLRITQKSMAVISLEMQHMWSHNVSGLLGADTLSQYDIEYDAAASTLSLYSVSNCPDLTPPWQEPYVKVPANLTEGHRLVMPAYLNGHPMTALFDTGATTVVVARSSLAKASVTEAMLAADPKINGSGVNGQSYEAPIHQFDSFGIARQLFKAPRLTIVDFPASDADMLVGEAYMHSRRFWLSYSTGAIFIQNSSAP